MSMISAGIAESNNKWKDELVQKLENAIELPPNHDHFDCCISIAQVKDIINELKEFYFSE